MTKRLVVPVEDEADLDAAVVQHLGRAPYFAIVDVDENGQIQNVLRIC